MCHGQELGPLLPELCYTERSNLKLLSVFCVRFIAFFHLLDISWWILKLFGKNVNHHEAKARSAAPKSRSHFEVKYSFRLYLALNLFSIKIKAYLVFTKSFRHSSKYMSMVVSRTKSSYGRTEYWRTCGLLNFLDLFSLKFCLKAS